jgi:hypothetical protein
MARLAPQPGRLLLPRPEPHPMTSAVDETFKAIRQACSASLWSQAVELVRAAAVAGVTQSEEEIVCRVRTPNRVVAPKVTLYPQDEEWDCDCDTSRLLLPWHRWKKVMQRVSSLSSLQLIH